MKTWTISKWSLALAVAALPLAGGCAREQVVSAPATVPATNPNPVLVAAPTPEVAEQELANAPTRLVATPQPAAPGVALDPSAAELVRLAQSGVDENVMLAYANNSARTFNLGPDQIIYLNDIGVPGNVVTAMIQRDQVLKTASLPPPAPAPVQVYQPPAPAPEINQPQPTMVVAESAPSPQVNVTATYFYDSLSPYGNWIEVEGYGRCWQPSVGVTDRGWTPYVDRGHWVYSDCGWYWASDYSWGWAPFHYGRWFQHSNRGWCWAPDTVWGPSWVSWRYNDGYCGWAPLPPTACYRPGAGFTYYGRSVGVSFGFGLGVNSFTFVAANRFCDPRPYHHRIPRQQVTQIFNNTVIINPVAEDRGNPRFHRGIPSKHIAEVTRTEIKPVKIHETPNRPGPGHGEKPDRKPGTLTVFQPALPPPPAQRPGNRIGEGVKPATPDTVIRRFDSDPKMHRGIPGKNSAPETVKSLPPELRPETAPVSRVPAVLPKPATPAAGPAAEPVRKTPVFGNNPRGHRNNENIPGTPAPAPQKEVPLNSLILRGPSGTAATPRTPPVQNDMLPDRFAPVAVPLPARPAPPTRQDQPVVQPAVREALPYRQPRGEKSIPAPTSVTPAGPVPFQTAPPPRTYQMPVPTLPPPATSKESRGTYTPAPERAGPARLPQTAAPAAPRVAMPQVSAPRAPAPQIGTRSIPAVQTPPVAAPKAPQNSSGGTRDKSQEKGSSPRNR